MQHNCFIQHKKNPLLGFLGCSLYSLYLPYSASLPLIPQTPFAATTFPLPPSFPSLPFSTFLFSPPFPFTPTFPHPLPTSFFPSLPLPPPFPSSLNPPSFLLTSFRLPLSPDIAQCATHITCSLNKRHKCTIRLPQK